MVVMLSFEVRSLAVCIDAVAALRGGRGGGPPQAALRRGGNSTALIVFFLNIIVPSVDKLYDRFLNRPKSAKNLKKCRACGARKRENKRKLFKIDIKPQKIRACSAGLRRLGGFAPQTPSTYLSGLHRGQTYCLAWAPNTLATPLTRQFYTFCIHAKRI